MRNTRKWMVMLSGLLLMACERTVSFEDPDVPWGFRGDSGPIPEVDADYRFPDASGAPFGAPCNPGGGECHPGLFCLEGPSGGRGFCSMTCPATSSGVCEGTPPGTLAYCVVTNVNARGDKGCAFLCELAGTAYECPGTQLCQTNEEPPGSGQRLCLP